MLTKSRVVQLLFMLVILITLFFWRTLSSTSKEVSHLSQIESPQSELLICDYNGDKSVCGFNTEWGNFSLEIKDLPIQAEEWIYFELNAPNDNFEITKAQIVGKSMFMGRIPVTFKKSSAEIFNAKSLVGACTTDQMIWDLQITVVNADVSEVIAFDFMVQK